ncbi:MAG TPA: hypothetical protein PKJ36_01280 [Flavihumibacter sp.]|nr:hypothetical protein [Flavihumibacter sp.]
MKKIFATIAMGLILSGAMAQDSTQLKKGPHHGKHFNRASFADLQLTADQKKQLAQLHQEHHEKVMANLSPEQKAKLAQRKADRQKAFAANSEKRFEHLKKALKLTDDQADKMKSLNEKYREEAGLIRANKQLAEAQQRVQLQKLSADHRSEVNAMLSAEQQETLRQLKQHPKRTVR